jgi:hypothetical protein
VRWNAWEKFWRRALSAAGPHDLGELGLALALGLGAGAAGRDGRWVLGVGTVLEAGPEPGRHLLGGGRREPGRLEVPLQAGDDVVGHPGGLAAQQPEEDDPDQGHPDGPADLLDGGQHPRGGAGVLAPDAGQHHVDQRGDHAAEPEAADQQGGDELPGVDRAAVAVDRPDEPAMPAISSSDPALRMPPPRAGASRTEAAEARADPTANGIPVRPACRAVNPRPIWSHSEKMRKKAGMPMKKMPATASPGRTSAGGTGPRSTSGEPSRRFLCRS